MKIAVDGMGGTTPRRNCKGLYRSSKVIDDEIYLVGPEDVLKKN